MTVIKNPLCACGCGKPVRWRKQNNQGKGGWNKFIQAHNVRTPIIPAEVCKKLSIPEGTRYPKAKPVSEKARQKMSSSKLGINNPNWKGGISPSRNKCSKT